LCLRTTRNTLDIESLNIVAIVPIRDENMTVGGRELYEYTIEHAKQSRYVSQTIVSTDNEEIRSNAIKMGASVPFLRDEAHSTFDVILEKLMQYTLKELEDRRIYPDVLVMMEITFPFRDARLIDEMIHQLVTEGLDTVIPARKEYSSCWIEDDGLYKRIDQGYIPRQFKKPTYTGLKGLGCVTQPSTIRKGQLFGESVGIYNVSISSKSNSYRIIS